MTERRDTPPPPSVDPLAGVMAFILPGAGHWLRGERKRAVYIAIGVFGLFFGGLLIGGIDVVDRRADRLETRLSFFGQAFVGPTAFVVDHIHYTRFKVIDPDRGPRAPLPGEQPTLIKSLGKVNEIGVLFALVAGMLNFIVILDAMFAGRPDPDEDEDEGENESGAGQRGSGGSVGGSVDTSGGKS